jgi:hypothetical protein
LAVSEGLMEGLMRGDEPSAPFGFLLSPQLLARTEARVTMQVIERAVSMIPPAEIVQFASVLLGNRDVRRAMKVTVHKALLRLLRHGSQADGPMLVLREWKRAELHRDVRVAIIQTALELLHSGAEATSEDVWTVLSSAAADPDLDPLVKVTLLVPDSRSCVAIGAPSSSSCGKLEQQLLKVSEEQKERMPFCCEQRYFEAVLCVIDRTEHTVGDQQREKALGVCLTTAHRLLCSPSVCVPWLWHCADD